MPLSNTELNRIADDIVSSTLRFYLNTVKPAVSSNGMAGRVTAGGGSFTSGIAVAASGYTTASNGDVNVIAAIDYGTASGGDPGTVIAWTAFRGASFVAVGDVPSTTIADGDSFSINAGSLNLNGSTT